MAADYPTSSRVKASRFCWELAVCLAVIAFVLLPARIPTQSFRVLFTIRIEIMKVHF